MNLAADMERRAQEAPEKIGLIFEDEEEFTFAQVNELSSRVANLLKLHGIGKGTRVAIYMQNSPDFVAIMFGSWKIGAVLVPINVMYQEKELRNALQSTDVSILITHKDKLEEVNKVRDMIKLLIVVEGKKVSIPDAVNYDQEILKMDAECPSFVPSENDEAVILFTGGTTGWPKAAVITHDALYTTIANLVAASRGGRPGPHPIAKAGTPPNIIAFPLFHSGGQHSLIFAYQAGRSVILMKRFQVDLFVKLVARHKVDSLVLMPTMVHDLVNYEGEGDLNSVKSVLVTGQELNPMVRKRFEERFQIPILQNYGSTEIGHVAGWTMRDIKEGRWKPGTVGKVYKGVEVEIRDDNDSKLPPGESGEICIKSPGAMEGYIGKSEQIIKNGWLYTGDIGYLDNDRCLYVIGRKRDMIKCGGFQVWPAEIEEVLLRHPKIEDVCVLGVPDERLGEIPKAYVVLKEKHFSPVEETKLINEIIEYCRQNIAHYKAVRAVKIIKELPKSEAGKVIKRLLVEQG